MGGISFSDMQEFNQAWVLKCELKLQNYLNGDIVTVKTWVNTLEKSRSVRALEMYVNGKNN
jgi:hypothetical protein